MRRCHSYFLCKINVEKVGFSTLFHFIFFFGYRHCFFVSTKSALHFLWHYSPFFSYYAMLFYLWEVLQTGSDQFISVNQDPLHIDMIGLSAETIETCIKDSLDPVDRRLSCVYICFCLFFAFSFVFSHWSYCFCCWVLCFCKKKTCLLYAVCFVCNVMIFLSDLEPLDALL